LGAFLPSGRPWVGEVLTLLIIGRVESEGSPLKPFLLLDPEEDKGIDLDFIGEAVKRFDEDENIKPAFIAAVEGLSQELAELNINDEYKPYVMVRYKGSVPLDSQRCAVD